MYLIIAVIMFIACPVFAGTNLLQNPGFESGDLSGWQIEGTAASGVFKDSTPLAQAYFQPARVVAHLGDYAAFNLTANFKRISSVFSQEIDVLPETSYRIGFSCLHGHPGQQVKIYPQILIDGKPIGGLSITGGRGYGTTTADYQQISGEFVTKQQTRARVSFVLNAGGLVPAGMSWDDFFVVCNQAAINISLTTGTVGTIINISGYNYQPDELIGMGTLTITTNENGAFAATFTIPVHTPGTLTITAVGAASGKTARALFYITPRGDFGDAPNSEIYPMNTGYFCKPDDFTNPLFLTHQAYFPIISHKTAGEECLGKGVSLEAGMNDSFYDEDGVPNIEPYKGRANQDSDDGLILPVDLKPGATNTVRFEVTLLPEAPEASRYVNILLDWNQDGVWTGNEWAVRNQGVDVPAGESRVITSREFLAGTNIGGCWMRLVLTREPVPIAGWDGGGEFEYGESEDYLLNIAPRCNLWIKGSVPEQAQLGQVIVYRLEYGNQGQALASGVNMVMNIPQGLTYLDDTAGARIVGDRLLWQIGELYPCQQGLIEANFRVEPWAGIPGENSQLTGTVSISSELTDAEPDNNVANWSMRVVSNPVPPQACVWPGDTDNNGVVDERDIFPIAMNWGKTGAARHGNIRWQVQSVSIGGDAVCFLYADANGDGWVNISDILPIGMNWGKTHEVSVSSYAPILHSEEMDHAKYHEAYCAMYNTLADTPQTDGVIQLKQALQGFMTAGNNQEITNAPAQSNLFQNYPNPFNPECWIPYELAERTQVVIRIYNISGQLVKTLELGEKEAGVYTTQSQAAYWNGRNEDDDEIASGVYFYQMQAGSRVMTKRVVVVK